MFNDFGLVLLVAVAGLAGGVLVQLMTDEVAGWCEQLAERLVRTGACYLPPERRAAGAEEWLAEVHAFGERRLSALCFAIRVRLRARETGRALGYQVPHSLARIRILARLDGMWSGGHQVRPYQLRKPLPQPVPPDLRDLAQVAGSLCGGPVLVLVLIWNPWAGLALLVLAGTVAALVARTRARASQVRQQPGTVGP